MIEACCKYDSLFHVSFCRLVEEDERKWTDENVNFVALKHFPNADKQAALCRPILYSNWLSKDYVPVDREELRDFVKARLKVRTKTYFHYGCIMMTVYVE